MPLTRIEVEDYNNFWHAEVEVGGINCKRKVCRAATFPQIIQAIEEAYYAERPEERPQPTTLEPDPEAVAVEEGLQVPEEVIEIKEQEPEPEPAPPLKPQNKKTFHL